MTKPTKPTVPPAPSRANPGPVFSQTADTFAAFQATLADYMDATADFVDDRADAALAAALGGDLPPLTGKALNMLRVNAGATAAEFRTPAQVRADLGISGIGSETLTATANVNTINKNDVYYITPGATGSPESAGFHRLLHIGESGTDTSQLAIQAGTPRLRIRNNAGGVGGDWVKIPTSGDILVSDMAATAVRLSSEGVASPLDTELATAAWVNTLIAAYNPAPRPITTAGAGQFLFQFGASGVGGTLPSGGTWQFIFIQRAASGQQVVNAGGGIAAGGSTYAPATAGHETLGWLWRIA